MPSRTADAIKAIRLAWEREQELVKNGQGTRDWTEEQQKDILNPDIGKAYDENGRAYEGQHMKSVEQYPEYQGNPDNIQFLTREEHLAAHRGSWQNQTNWYYDPEKKEYTIFGSDELIPCKPNKLSNPIIISPDGDYENKTRNSNSIQQSEQQADIKDGIPKTNEPFGNIGKQSFPFLFKLITNFTNMKNEVKQDGVRSFFENHYEGIAKGLDVLGQAANIVAPFVSSAHTIKNNWSHNLTNQVPSSEPESVMNSKVDAVLNQNDTKRTSPEKHTVDGHERRVHTKEGIKKIKVPQYERGVDKDSK